ncbi:hypothetical protein BLNAU_2138 [Blattamonas nauphoetae]|uniref:Uncharacterized protein n=1 Tax=Blattamonas nauphoetae TaxID=2049346 RepID=A0ABQ9YGA8_9EUKA|nr:hypothetical protein BLNAU_2138 [Blattamonas nauphoetae]
MEQTKQQLDAQTALDEEQRREESDWDVPGEEEAEAEGLAKKERLESTRPRLIVETHTSNHLKETGENMKGSAF